MKEGLGLSSGEKSIREALDAFSEVSKKYYTPYFKSREYIFENYIANIVYMTGFPFVYGNIYAPVNVTVSLPLWYGKFARLHSNSTFMP